MSIRLMTRVWDLDLSSELQHTLLFLADKADDDGLHCYPSVEYIAWALNKSERSVQYALSTLREKGLIVPLGPIKGGRGITTEYRITLDGAPVKYAFRAWKKGANSAPIEKGATDDTKRVQPVEEKGATGGVSFNNEPSGEPSGGTVSTGRKATALTLYEQFKRRIQPRSRTYPEAKIIARLKTFTPEEVATAINHFADDEWWMTNNAHQGADWFFESDRRVERFLNLKPRSGNGGGGNGAASTTGGQASTTVRKPTGLEKYG